MFGSKKSTKMQEKPMIEGVLLKRAVKSGRNWKKRYFALFGNKLMYKTKQSDKAWRGDMLLTENFFVQDAVKATRQKYGFIVSDFETTYYLAADKQEVKDFWMHTIARIIRKLQQDMDYYGVKGYTGVKVPASHLPRTEEQKRAELQARMKAYESSRAMSGLSSSTSLREPSTSDLLPVPVKPVGMVLSTTSEIAITMEQQAMLDETAKPSEKTDEKERKQSKSDEKRQSRRHSKSKDADRSSKRRSSRRKSSRSSKNQEEELRKEEERMRAEKEQREMEEKLEAEKAEAELRKAEEELRRAEEEAKRLEEEHRKQEEEAQLRAAQEAERKRQEEEEKKAAKKSAAKVKQPKGGIASRVAMWQKKADTHQDLQDSNVFSGNYKGTAALKPGDEGYGKAVAGSKTEARAKAAADWVDKEIDKLVGVIVSIGKPDPEENNNVTATFGPLFIAYQDISDSLVGILMRAKRRKRLWYEGDMLFQGIHDHVKIQVLVQ